MPNLHLTVSPKLSIASPFLRQQAREQICTKAGRDHDRENKFAIATYEGACRWWWASWAPDCLYTRPLWLGCSGEEESIQVQPKIALVGQYSAVCSSLPIFDSLRTMNDATGHNHPSTQATPLSIKAARLYSQVVEAGDDPRYMERDSERTYEIVLVSCTGALTVPGQKAMRCRRALRFSFGADGARTAGTRESWD